jgi:hypothetical protein
MPVLAGVRRARLGGSRFSLLVYEKAPCREVNGSIPLILNEKRQRGCAPRWPRKELSRLKGAAKTYLRVIIEGGHHFHPRRSPVFIEGGHPFS